MALTTSPVESDRREPTVTKQPERRSPRRVLRRLTLMSATTPGVLTLVAVLLVGLCTAWGAVAATTAQERMTEVRDLATRSEPLSDDAQQIFGSLSDADATASSAFLSGGVEPAALTARYQTDLAGAGAALAAAVAAADNPDAEHALAQLTTRLPVYTGLVATARADNRQGLPVGAAYLREASAVMRSELLPAAQQLYHLETDQLAGDQDGAAAIPVWPGLFGGLVLVALGAAQFSLSRRTNRLLNLGLLSATLAVLVVMVWGAVALSAVAGHIDRSRAQGSEQVQLLVQARYSAMEARSNETLALVTRGNGQNYQQGYDVASIRMGGTDGTGGLLGQVRAAATDDTSRAEVDGAIADAKRWLDAHRQVAARDAAGEYNAAVRAAIDAGPASSGSAEQSLDEHLSRAIIHAREGFSREAEQAHRALTGFVVGIAMLISLAVAGIVVGIGQRLREYR